MAMDAPQPADWEAEFLAAALPSDAADAATTATAATAAATLPPARPPWALRVLRSVQLDADRLDAELRAMLHEQLSRALAVQGGALPAARVAALEPEISAALAFLVWACTVGRGRATPGSQLMNLRYRDERPFSRSGGSAARESAAAASAATRAAGAPLPPSWVFGDGAGVEGGPLTGRQRALFGLGYCVLPYLWARAGRALARAGGGGGRFGGGGFGGSGLGGGYGDDGDNNGLFYRTTPDAQTAARGGQQPQRYASAAEWARRAMPRAEAAYRVACFLNLLAFLRRGRYRSLLERALSARLVPERPCAPRSVSFEYLNRQLVWQELSEFVLFVLPLLDARRMRAGVRRWLPQPEAAGGALGASGGTAGAPGGWALAPALPGEEEEDEEEEDIKADKGWWAGKRGGRRRRRGAAAGDADGGGDGDGDNSSGGALRTKDPPPASRGGAVGGWLAQRLGGAASVMAAAVAAGAARGMAQGHGGEEAAAGESAAAAGGRNGGGDDAETATATAMAAAAGAASSTSAAPQPDQAACPPGPCPLCGVAEILTPYAALPCRHVFCYYCLRANTEGDALFACPLDGRRVAALRRWAPAELLLLGGSAPTEGP